jgi:hypothetical protein
MAKTWVLIEQEQTFCDVCGKNITNRNRIGTSFDGRNYDLCMDTILGGMRCEDRLKLSFMAKAGDIWFCGNGNESVNKKPIRFGA